MTQNTKNCQACGSEFEYTRSTARFCSPACRIKAHRLRRVKPVSLEHEVRSQKRSDRPHDRHVQRSQQLLGQPVLSTRQSSSGVKESPGENGRKRISPGPNGWKDIQWHDEVFEQALRLMLEEPHPRLRRLVYEAATQWVNYVQAGVHPAFGVPVHPARRSPLERQIRMAWWYVTWRYHEELTEREALKIVHDIPTAWERIRPEIEKELKEMELATVAAQNEEILARLKNLQATAEETFARVTETVERLRERFPNDAEVSAAVDEFLAELP